MATTKVTFTFDESTIRCLDQAAKRLVKPKSEIVRDAIQDYYHRIGRLSEEERRRMLRALDAFALQPSTRSQREAETELNQIRTARWQTAGGRRRS